MPRLRLAPGSRERSDDTPQPTGWGIAGREPLAAPRDIALHIDRLVRGEFKSEYLTELFLWARDIEAGREPLLRDIGDFIAHRQKREKGLTWQRAQDFVDCARATFVDHSKEAFLLGCQACLRLSSDQEVLKLFGRPRAVAERKLRGAFGKIVNITDQGFQYQYPLTLDEQKALALFQPLRTRIGDMNDVELSRQLRMVLEAENCLDYRGKAAFQALTPTIGAYAISRMHDTHLDVRGATNAVLYASNSQFENGQRIALSLKFDLDSHLRQTREIMATTAGVREYMPSFVPTQVQLPGIPRGIIPQALGLNSTWDHVLEINDQRQLVIAT